MFCIKIFTAGFLLFFTFLSTYASDRKHAALFPVELNGVYGFIDRNGKTIIKPQFHEARDFHEGLAAVAVGVGVVHPHWGYAKVEGRDQKVTNLPRTWFYSHGKKLKVKNLESSWYYVDDKKGAVVKVNDAQVTAADQYKWGYINEMGELVIPSQFDDASDFHEGLAQVGFYEGYSDDNPVGVETRLFLATGFINRKGAHVKLPEYQFISDFSEGLASACFLGYGEESSCGYLDRKGKWAIGPYRSATTSPFHEKLAAVCFHSPDPSHGWNPDFRTGTRCGFIDQKGKVVIPLKFGNAGDFSGGLAYVKIGDHWSYIDRKGKIVFSLGPDVINVYAFSQGLAAVSMQTQDGKKFGYIDKSGKILIQPGFDDAQSFHNGLAKVRIGEKWGYIDRGGKFAWPPTN